MNRLRILHILIHSSLTSKIAHAKADHVLTQIVVFSS